MNDDIIRVDSYDFEERVDSGVVLVFFYEHLSTQSRALELVIEEIAHEYSDRILVLAVDAEQSPDIIMHYDIEMIPCVMILSGGDIVEQIDGANLPNVYSDIIDELI